jgi:hypothetical protein
MNNEWKEQLDLLELCLKECVDLHATDDFESVSSPHEDISLFCKQVNDGRVLKCTGLVPHATAEKLFREVFNQDEKEKKRLGQDFLVKDTILEQLDEFLVFRRQEFKLVWPMTNRETVTIRGGRKLADGKYVQFETSVEHPKYPVQSSPVRAVVKKACFFYEDTEDGVRATYLADVEMGGHIPQWLVQMGDSKACDRIISFRRVAKEKSLK